MWFFDYFEYAFEYLETEFDRLADAIEDVWIIGDYLAYPFRAVALAFYNLKSASASASEWADDVYTDVTGIFDDLISRIEVKWSILTQTPFEIYVNIEDYIKKLLENTLLEPWQYFEAIKGFIERKWLILKKTTYERFIDLKDHIRDEWEILKETKETIWSYIRDFKLSSYVDSKIINAKNLILGFIVAALGYLITEAFKFLDNNWDSFKDMFSWLITKIIELISDRADDFADKLFELIEKVFEKI